MATTQLTDPDSLVEYGLRRVVITFLAVLCALLEIVDVTIVNVAIDQMRGGLGASLTDIGWVITAYAIGNVIIIPMTSWLSMQFGRRYYFAGSIIVFTIGSFLCGNATSLTEIIIFRFLQGMGGGALLVTAQTIITESYPIAKRGMAQAIYGMGVIVGPTIGPPLGGYIIDHFSWRDIFYVNIPIGIVATILTLTFLRSPKYGDKLSARQVDWWGMGLLASFVGSLQYVLENGQQDNWLQSKLIIFLAIVSIFSLVFFIWRELVYEHPIVNLRVLRDKNLRVGTILTFVLGVGLFGSNFILPIYTQSTLGWTATAAGLLMIPGSITTGLMMPIAGKMLERNVSPKYLICIGLTIFFLFTLWMAHLMTPDTGGEYFFWPVVFRGFGMSLLFVPLTTMALSTLHGKNIGEGASFTSMTRQLGGSFGIAIITTLMARFNEHHRVELIANYNATSFSFQQHLHALQQAFISKGFSINNALGKAYESLNGILMKQSSVLTYIDIFILVGIMFLVCVPIIFIFVKKDAGKTNIKKTEEKPPLPKISRATLKK